jgi:hypothetical protein
MKEKIAVIPVALVLVLATAVILLRLAFEGAIWLDILAWSAVAIAVVNPGVFLLMLPLRKALKKSAAGYMVREVVTVEGVSRETLDRSAAIAEGESDHPIAACLRAFCGDVAAPPDKFVEMPGLGVSAQFSNQMIHAGSAEYMRGLNIEAPEVQGKVAYVALENRLLGYYRLLDPAQTGWLQTRLKYAVISCAALKITVWALAAFVQIEFLPIYASLEIVSLVIVYNNLRRFFRP